MSKTKSKPKTSTVQLEMFTKWGTPAAQKLEDKTDKPVRPTPMGKIARPQADE